MRFKSIFWIIAVTIALSFSQLGCGYFKEGGAPKQNGLNLTNSLGCLNQFDAKIRNYFKGRSVQDSQEVEQNSKDVEAVLDCGVNALSFFMDHVRGESRDAKTTKYIISDHYTPDELKRFLETYLLDQKRLPNTLVSGLMSLKVALLGGDANHLSRTDIQRIQTILRTLKIPARAMASFMPLTMERAKTMSLEEIRSAGRALEAAGEIVGTTLSSSAKSYSLDDFKLLLGAVSEVYENGDSGTGPRYFLSHIKVFQGLKLVFVGDGINAVRQDQWKELIKMGARLYSLQLFVSYLSHEKEKTDSAPNPNGKGVERRQWELILTGVEEGLSILLRAADNHAENYLADATLGTSGVTADSLTVLLRALVDSLLLPQSLDVENFVSAAMGLKVAVVGGTRNKIHREEIRQFQTMLQAIRGPFLEVADFFPLKASNPGFEDPQWVDQASQAYGKLLKIGGSLVETSATTYAFEDFELIVKSLSDLVEAPPTGNWITFLKSNADLIRAFKGALLGGKSNEIEKEKWKTLFESSDEAIRLYLGVQHLFSGHFKHWTYGEGLHFFTNLANNFFQFFEKIIEQQDPDRWGQRVLSFEKMKTLLAAIAKAGWLPEGLTPETVYETLVDATRQILRVRHSTIEPKDVTGISIESLRVIEKAFHQWQRRQEVLAELFLKAAKGDERELFGVTIKRTDILDYLIKLPGRLPELEEMVARHAPMFDLNQDYVTIDPINMPSEFSFFGLSEINWCRELILFLTEGYVEDEARTHPIKRILVNELRNFYEFTRPLGIQLKWVDPRFRDSAEGRFLEAGLFTKSGDGDAFLDEFEGTEEFILLVKGRSRARLNHDKIARLCSKGAPLELDTFGLPLIDATCYRDQFYDASALSEHWAGLPGLVQYYNGLDANKKKEFQRVFESAARRGGYLAEGKFESSDSEAYMILAYYLEGVFLKFDSPGANGKSADGVLRFNELIPPNEAGFEDKKYALSVLYPTLQTLAKGQNIQLNKSASKVLFSYVLMKGKVAGSSRMGIWYSTTFESSIFADRMAILRVIGILKNPQSMSASGQEKETTSSKDDLGKNATSDWPEVQEMADIWRQTAEKITDLQQKKAKESKKVDKK